MNQLTIIVTLISKRDSFSRLQHIGCTTKTHVLRKVIVNFKNIATVADSQDEIELSDTAFEHSQKDAFKAKVKQLALDKVMQQKALYESSLGVILTPMGFRENRLRVQGTQGAEMLEEIIVTA